MRRIIAFIALFASAIAAPTAPNELFNRVDILIAMAPNIPGEYKSDKINNNYIFSTANWSVSLSTHNLDLPLVNTSYITRRFPPQPGFLNYVFESDTNFQTKPNSELIIHVDCANAKIYRKLESRRTTKHFNRKEGKVFYYGDCYKYVVITTTYKNTKTGNTDIFSSNNLRRRRD
ncbi:hypothetical protein NY_014-012 [NY_014 poxvirus]|uniref:hypothetical protein n=1 Tax=NY_014 poxvirus TaxID=2025360 RepID=UPI000B99FDAC|nr:hypothetical protein CKM51_gp012 [NY_014 poxvirus]AST09413.1 hypothetical protein NY_014-012 [NY_014 poxvirus]